MIPRTLFALFACVTVWAVKLQLLVHYDAQVLFFSHGLQACVTHSHSYCGFLFPICRTLHLSALNFIFHVLAQFWRLSRSSWRSLRSCSVIIALKTFASSANISIQLVTTSGMSFMNSTNMVGPMALPCGTPEITFFHADRLSPFIATLCLRSNKKCLHHPSIVPVIP